MPVRPNIQIGQRFGHVVVIDRVATKTAKSYHSALICLCDCGDVHRMYATNLYDGRQPYCAKKPQKPSKSRADRARELAITKEQQLRSTCQNVLDDLTDLEK